METHREPGNVVEIASIWIKGGTKTEVMLHASNPKQPLYKKIVPKMVTVKKM